MKVKVLIFSIIVFVPCYILAQNNHYLKGQVAFEQSDFNTSVDYLNTYLNEYTGNEKALYLRAKANLELRNYKQVIDDLGFLKLSYNDEILLMQSRAYAGLANNELSIQLLDKYLNTNNKLPEPIIQDYIEFQKLKSSLAWKKLWSTERYSKKEVILNNAIYAIKSKKYSEADERLEELLLRFKRSDKGYYYKGKLLFDKKLYSEAVVFFENAIEIEPENPDYQLERAKCNTKLNKQKKAIEQFDAIIQSDSLNLLAYLGRSEAYLVNKDYEKAENDITKFRSYYPQSTEAQYINAEINTQSGDFLSAISTYGKLIKSNPSQVEYFVGRANSYMATKTYKYAIKDYSMALDLDPKNIEVYKLKANAHRLAGEQKKACIEWEHAVKLGDIESMNFLSRYCK